MALFDTLKKYIRTNKGVAAVWFGLTIPVVVSSVGLSVDVGQTYLMRERLSQALDAAALAAATMSLDDADAIEDKVNDFITANYPEDKVGFYTRVEVESVGDTLQLQAWAELNPAFMGIMGVDKIDVSVTSEVTRVAGANIELALVLDISNSMNNLEKIVDLKDAAKDLIDIVVYDNQEDYYSKVAIVPYSMAVNVGSYAAQVRGTVPDAKTITGATRANPVVVTSAAHGYNNGDRVYITGIRGMTQINNRTFTVANRTTNTFQLSGVDGRNYNAYTNTGSLWCTTAGCQYYYFINANNNAVTFPNSTCVSERVGANQYTDAAPSTTLVGRNYAGTSNPCTTSQIVPLSSDKEGLKAQIDALVASGSTGGQVGVGWGMYMLSPTWGYLWPEASRPAAYKSEELHKIMVLMTDGEYNSPYCNGVIARNATTGSGSAADHSNCDASNGNSYAQARLMCDAMKADDKKIEIYAIGFRVAEYPDGESLMEYCASDEEHFFTADDGDELREAFQSIAKNVSALFLSR